MSQNPSAKFYRHYKNKPYKYLGLVRHSETLEELALYETLYENNLGRLWVRPKDMFFENVEHEGTSKPRFERVNFNFKSSDKLDEKDFAEVSNIYFMCFGEPMQNAKFENKLQAHKHFLFLIAYDGNKMVAFKFGYAQDQTLFYSWMGAVLPEYQNLGLASELMKIQHDWCAENSFKKIETRTRNQFSNMISLNLKFGFKIIGTQTSAGDDVKIILEKSID